MTYYYGFLFSIIVNSIMWFAISTVVNKYYWHYTGFKDEFYLISKYIIHRKKNRSIINIQDNNKVDPYKRERPNNNKIDSLSKNPDDDKTDNIGSPLKL